MNKDDPLVWERIWITREEAEKYWPTKKEKEMKWTKFKDGKPNTDAVYITDYKQVWVCKSRSWDTIAWEDPNRAWAEIELPEVPKEVNLRDSHKCLRVEVSIKGKCILQCLDDENGLLYVSNGIEVWKVNFCPFCGYSPKQE